MILLLMACTPAAERLGPTSPPAIAAPAIAAPADDRVAATSGELPLSCEPSAMVLFKGDLLVADNEVKRSLYRYDTSLGDVRSFELGDAAPVDDIEALALWGDEVLVVGSYSRKQSGREDPERQRIARVGGAKAVPMSLNFGVCAACETARSLGPGEGGLNIEGAMVHGDTVWLGLRSPLMEQSAHLIGAPLTDDGELVVTRTSALPLGGQGIRELVPWADGMLVVTGPTGETKADHRLWYVAWDPFALDWGGPTDLGRLPPDAEALRVVAPDTVLVLLDGLAAEGKTGPCARAGRWERVSVLGLPEAGGGGPDG